MLSPSAILAEQGRVSTAILGNAGLEGRQSARDIPRGAGTRGSQDFRVPTMPQSIRTVPGLLCPLGSLSLPLSLSLASAGKAIFLVSAHAPGGLCAEPGLTHLTAFPPGKFTGPTHLPLQRSRPACGVELLCPGAAGAAWLSAYL